LAYCSNVNISVFGSNVPGEGLTTIEQGALYDSGKGTKEISLLDSIIQLESDNVPYPGNHYAAFENYAYDNSSKQSMLASFTSVKAAGEIID
jgi:hypothetical protein